MVDRLHDSGRHRATRRAVLRLYRASKQPVSDAWSRQVGERLRPLDLPALVVWGARDAYLPVAQARRQRDVFPRAEIVELPDSGHWPMHDNPDGFGNAVLPFLRRVVGSTAYH